MKMILSRNIVPVIALIVSALLSACAGKPAALGTAANAPGAVPAGSADSGYASDDPGYSTLLSPAGMSIVRRPGSADYRRGGLGVLPVYNPASSNGWQVDVRGYDLSGLDLSERLPDLLHADFDSVTKWPAALPEGFDPARIMDLGKNPGLGVRSLHDRGITGKGVAVAIIDQTLLTDHVEYADRLRLYEEIHNPTSDAQMHGPAVASIAVGRTVGVAPEADLYYIAETHGIFRENSFDWDFTWLAKSIDRILEVNRDLPEGSKIRVISASIGWSPNQKGFAEVTEAVNRAKAAGIFVVSSSLSPSYDGKFNFHGLGRRPLSDPDTASSYCPGSWWASQFYRQGALRAATLLVPMDSRCTASPTGSSDYVFYPQGGWSWSIPYIAGLYALACQVCPEMTPDLFWAAAIGTGTAVETTNAGKTYVLEKVVNPVALIDEVKKAAR